MAYNRRKRKVKKNIPEAIVHIQSTYNNTIVTFADKDGNVICWASSGTIGYKGSKKKTPYAGGVAAEAAAKTAIDQGVKIVDVETMGLGPARENAIRALQGAGLEVRSMADKTPVPHNGCRPPKRPRN